MTKEALDVITVLAFCVVGVSAVNAIAIYSIVQLLVSGKPLFQRRHDPVSRFSER